MLYRFLIRPLLYRLSAEKAHRLTVKALELLQVIPLALPLLRLLFPRPAGVEVKALGLNFPTPIGLAAGFDKDAEVFRGLGAIGFGFVEIGTITGEGQDGNPQPRLFRLPADRALINRMGFNNRGATFAAQHLSKIARDDLIVGINIGKTKLASPAEAIDDYRKSTRLLGPLADYMVVNVSSPNTPGLRDLQAVESLRPLLKAVREELDQVHAAGLSSTDRQNPEAPIPLLVKIAPDLNDDDIVKVAALALELKLEGIIATNTTIDRSGLNTADQTVENLGAGGLSGAPLKRRSLEVLRILRQQVKDQLILISAGGIETPKETFERLSAGATLVQVYSGLVYHGPALPTRLARGLKGMLRKSGKEELSSVIGGSVPPPANQIKSAS